MAHFLASSGASQTHLRHRGGRGAAPATRQVTTTFFFVRHGSHDLLGQVLCGRTGGVVLNAEGLREAERLAARLARERITALYVSPLHRARQTAEPLAKALGLTPISAEELNELDFGDWTGISFEALQKQPAWRFWNHDRSQHRPPGGESMLEAQVRVARWLAAATSRHAQQGVVAVCHSDIIKVAIAYASGLSLDHHHRLEISPGSISVVVANDWGLKVRGLNEVPL